MESISLDRQPCALGEEEVLALTNPLSSSIENALIHKASNHACIEDLSVLMCEHIRGDLAKAAFRLVCQHTHTVAILVGNSSNLIMWPPTDTDGPGGAFALAQVLWKIGKKVIIVCDDVNHDQVYPALQVSQLWKMIEEAQEEVDKDRFEYIQFLRKPTATREEKSKLKDLYRSVDHVINVGRPGPGKEDEYWSRDLTSSTHYQPDFALIFEWARQSAASGAEKRVYTTAIGELGNELGMGALHALVEKHVRDGEWMACPITSDFTLLSTVVNWGAWGLANVIAWTAHVMHPLHSIQTIEKMLPQIWDQAAILKKLVSEASRDGVTAERRECMDGYEAAMCWSVLTQINKDVRTALKQNFEREETKGLPQVEA